MKSKFILAGWVLLTAIGCAPSVPTPIAASPAAKIYTAADVDQALTDARKFRDEGKYDEALERHLWYHKNALRYAPAHAGVRLSFALGDWADLGRQYPKAQDAMRLVRDETLASYRKDPTDTTLFGDVMSIDLELGDMKAAKELFYEGRQHRAYDSILMLSLPSIIASGDKKWAGDIIGNPTAQLERMVQSEKMAEAVMKQNAGSSASPPPDMDEIYAGQIADLIRAVNETHGKSVALSLQKEALKSTKSPQVRDALK